jgi:hypothetical protein
VRAYYSLARYNCSPYTSRACTAGLLLAPAVHGVCCVPAPAAVCCRAVVQLLLFHSHSQTQKQRLLVEFTKLILFY